MTRPLLGILGGMGPAATHYFYRLILDMTDASCDQDHVPSLIYNATFLPDRVACIQQKQEDLFLTQLTECLALLENAGITCLAIPCNTVHYFINHIRDDITVPFFHLIESCIHQLKRDGITEVTLLSTLGTIQTRLYHDVSETHGITVHVPQDRDQQVISQSITRIKAGKDPSLFHADVCAVLDTIQLTNGPSFILGCTELPLIFQRHPRAGLIDPMEALARDVLSFCNTSQS